MGVISAKGEGGICARPAMDQVLLSRQVTPERASSAPKRRRRVDHNSHQLNLTHVTTDQQLDECVKAIGDKRVGYLALDIETTGLKPWFSCIRTVQIAVEEPKSRQWVIDCYETDPTPALRMLEDEKLAVITCNGSFEHSHIYWHYGVKLPGMWDLCYASREVNSGEKMPHTYAALMERHVGMQISKAEQNGAWDSEQLTESQLHYAAMDVAGSLDIYRRLYPQVDKSALHEKVSQATGKAIDDASSQLEARWRTASIELQRFMRAMRAASPEQARRLLELSRRAPLNFQDRARLAEMAA